MDVPQAKARNYWKYAFFLTLVLWIGTTATLLFSLLDQGITITHMRSGYADCEAHRDFLSAQATGRLTRDAMQSRRRDMDGAEVEIQYADDDTYRASYFGASETPDFEHR